jgi:aconitate hydratase
VGILPLVFADEADYDVIEQGDEWEITGLHAALKAGQDLTVRNLARDRAFKVAYSLTERQVAIILAGGLLNYIRDSA